MNKLRKKDIQINLIRQPLRPRASKLIVFTNAYKWARRGKSTFAHIVVTNPKPHPWTSDQTGKPQQRPGTRYSSSSGLGPRTLSASSWSALTEPTNQCTPMIIHTPSIVNTTTKLVVAGYDMKEQRGTPHIYIYIYCYIWWNTKGRNKGELHNCIVTFCVQPFFIFEPSARSSKRGAEPRANHNQKVSGRLS